MGFFEKIKAGLTKTRQSLQNTLGGIFAGFHGIDDDFYDDLEESLILADLGVDTAVKAVEQLREKVNMEHLKSADEVREALAGLNDAERCGIVLRAKGIVPGVDGSWIHFDFVPEETNVRTGTAEYTGRLCVIGSKLNEAALKELFHL